ncbi:Exosome RNA helicase MTR4 [Coemansia sp. RSA 2705]|nr:Exosome RNA helicase MTR4 [Coemansia sp. RSA 2705]
MLITVFKWTYTTDVVGGIDKNKQNSSKTNKGKQTSSTSDIYKIVCMIMVCNYHPVIVFCFFKHNCKFSQICRMFTKFEGSLIRVFRRLEKSLRQMCQAAKAIGNIDLENKFANSIVKIKCDTIFAVSLYL